MWLLVLHKYFCMHYVLYFLFQLEHLPHFLAFLLYFGLQMFLQLILLFLFQIFLFLPENHWVKTVLNQHLLKILLYIEQHVVFHVIHCFLIVLYIVPHKKEQVFLLIALLLQLLYYLNLMLCCPCQHHKTQETFSFHLLQGLHLQLF